MEIKNSDLVSGKLYKIRGAYYSITFEDPYDGKIFSISAVDNQVIIFLYKKELVFEDVDVDTKGACHYFYLINSKIIRNWVYPFDFGKKWFEEVV